MNQQLVDYIKQSKGAGKNEFQIKHDLMKADWKEKEIDEALKDAVHRSKEGGKGGEYSQLETALIFLISIALGIYLWEGLVLSWASVFSWAFIIVAIGIALNFDFKKKRFKTEMMYGHPQLKTSTEAKKSFKVLKWIFGIYIAVGLFAALAPSLFAWGNAKNSDVRDLAIILLVVTGCLFASMYSQMGRITKPIWFFLGLLTTTFFLGFIFWALINVQ